MRNKKRKSAALIPEKETGAADFFYYNMLSMQASTKSCRSGESFRPFFQITAICVSRSLSASGWMRSPWQRELMDCGKMAVAPFRHFRFCQHPQLRMLLSRYFHFLQASR